MSLFSCKACQAHKEHIKTLEAQIKFLQTQLTYQMAPAPNFISLDADLAGPTIQPQYFANDALESSEAQQEISANQLLTGDY